jgi:hypothetical protein
MDSPQLTRRARVLNLKIHTQLKSTNEAEPLAKLPIRKFRARTSQDTAKTAGRFADREIRDKPRVSSDFLEIFCIELAARAQKAAAQVVLKSERVPAGTVPDDGPVLGP